MVISAVLRDFITVNNRRAHILYVLGEFKYLTFRWIIANRFHILCVKMYVPQLSDFSMKFSSLLVHVPHNLRQQ